MADDEKLRAIKEDIHAALQGGYLSMEQVSILETRLTFKSSYSELLRQFSISGRTALTHALYRTAALEYWSRGMNASSFSYLSKFDEALFIKIITDAADDCNCIPAIYGVSLAHYLRKKRNARAFYLLTAIGCPDLASRFTKTAPPSRTWLFHKVQSINIKIVTGQTIEFERRRCCNVSTIFFYFQLHSFLFNRSPCLILNMDETMLTAKRRLKVLAQKGQLPLIPEAVKVPHLTGCVTFTASGYLFEPLIILPEKKTLRTLTEYSGLAYFAGSAAGWNTRNLFIYYVLILVCQLSSYRLSLPEKLRDERILLLLDGHPSRFSFKACLILYLFDVDMVLIPPHTSHLLQAFDVSVASPLKTYFKENLISQRFNLYIEEGIDISKQTARELRDSLIKSFINSMRKSATIDNIQSGFKKSGIIPIDVNKPLSSEYAMLQNDNTQNNDLLRNYWLNSTDNLKELFYRENGRMPNEGDYSINLREIVKDLKEASIEDGKSLSPLPPLILENGSQVINF